VPTDYIVRVDDGLGCTGSAMIVVQVRKNPVAVILKDSDDDQLCIGSSIELAGSCQGGGCNGLIPSWNITAQDIVSLTYEPLEIGIDSVIYSPVNEYGCTDSDTLIVTVNPLPTVTVVADKNEVCQGSSVVLSATGADAAYIWNNDEEDSIQTVVPEHLFTTYIVTGTNTFGCKDEDQVVVSVNKLPHVDVTGEGAICKGESVTIVAVASDGTGDKTFDWSSIPINISNTVIGTPGEDTTYQVRVTDEKGCLDSASHIVNVKDLPIQDLGDNFEICDEDSVEIFATKNHAYTYLWSTLSTEDKIKVLPVVNTTSYYSVEATDNGCTASDEVAVTVNALPTASFTMSVDEICTGDYVTLTSTSSVDVDTTIWKDGHLVSEYTEAPLVDTEYSLIVANAKGCRDASDTKTLVVHVSPVVNAGLDDSLCIGLEYTLIASSIVEQATHDFLWSTTDTDSIAKVTPDTLKVYTVSVTGHVSPTFSCVSSDEVEIVVRKRPTVDIAMGDTLCVGEADTVKVDVSGTFAPYEYLWSTGETVDSIVLLNLSDNKEVIATITDASGCESITSTTVVVSKPAVDLGADKSVVCAESNVSIVAEDSVISGGVVYEWAKSAAWNISIPTAAAFNEDPPAVGDSVDYTVTITDKFSCTATDHTRIIVQETQEPKVRAEGGDSTVCLGFDQTYVELIIEHPEGKDDLYKSFQWASGSTTPMIKVFNSGSFDATVWDSIGCKWKSNVLVMKLQNAPIADIAPVTDTTLIVDFRSVSINASTHSWNFGDATAVSNEIDPTHTFAQAGFYTISLTVDPEGNLDICNPDTDTEIIEVFDTTFFSVPEMDKIVADFNVYPNPTDRFVNVSASVVDQTDVEIEVFTVEGKLVYSQTQDAVFGKYSAKLDLSDLPMGVYLLKMTTNKGMIIKKLEIK